MNKTQSRTVEEQQRLNGYMKRKDVQEYMLFRSTQVEPATPEQVKAFLKKAPPEVRILLNELTSETPDGVGSDELAKARKDRITAGVVGVFLEPRASQPVPHTRPRDDEETA